MSEILPPPDEIGLQPVRINPEPYRLFVETLNAELVEMEARFADRRECGGLRQQDVQLDHESTDLNLDDTTQQGPAI